MSPFNAYLAAFVNYDIMTFPITQKAAELSLQSRKPTLSPMFDSGEDLAHAYIAAPVFSNFNKDSQAEVVGFVGVYVPWESYFENILPQSRVEGIDVVLDDSCGKPYTFRLNGANATILGSGDMHNTDFDSLGQIWTLGSESGDKDAEFYVFDGCVYRMSVYPTQQFEDSYTSKRPITYAVAVGIIFIFTAFVFLMYDWAVQLRQDKVLNAATRTQAIVSSLFPKNVQERIFKDVEDEVKQDEKTKTTISRLRGNRTKDQLRNFLDDGNADTEKHSSLKSKPIADLFPEATVIFADLVGFTAWSSTREPTQVFTLLENIYHSFDEIAKRRRIFKVETVGDCYVAVSGLPEPRKDHAVAMARFSKDILHKFRDMVKQMVVELGPDTEDLGLRIGLHSGPVTAGVLRGERARFQLFGDTMNTTAVCSHSAGTP